MIWLAILSCSNKSPLIFCGSSQNDIFPFLKEEGFHIIEYDSPERAIGEAEEGSKASVNIHMPSTIELMFDGESASVSQVITF
jgi:hypothetical protein